MNNNKTGRRCGRGGRSMEIHENCLCVETSISESFLLGKKELFEKRLAQVNKRLEEIRK